MAHAQASALGASTVSWKETVAARVISPGMEEAGVGRRVVLAAMACLLGWSGPLLAASGYAQPSVYAWHRADLCNKKAFALFPDYTKEQIARRDAYVRKCLSEQNLPLRDNIGSK
jgi:hypothetical protein